MVPAESPDARLVAVADDQGAALSYAEDADRPTPWHRYLAALGRYRWLVLGCLVLGGAGGFVGAKLSVPEYEAHATIWISTEDERRGPQAGPIQAQELLNPTGWDELFRSLRVMDSVVLKRRLYLGVPKLDSALFSDFTIAGAYQPGGYQLKVAPTGNQYVLTTGPEQTVVDRGALGDSVGRRLGFRWKPGAAALRQVGTVQFSVSTLSQASEALIANLTTVLPDNPSYMRVSLVGDSPALTAAILNEWMTQFVKVAGELKRRKVDQLTSILQTQTTIAHGRLNEAEQALETFERHAIAQGQQAAVNAGKASAAMLSAQSLDGGTAASGPGIGGSGTATVTDYYALKFARDNLHDDVVRVQDVLNNAPQGKVNPEDLLAVPALMVGAEDLRAAIQDFTTKTGDLRQLKTKYTDSYKPVQDLQAQVTTLQTATIPQLAAQSLTRLRVNERNLSQRIASAQLTATQLPGTEIEEMRRQRDVMQSSQIYNTLEAHYEEALLAEQSAIPDVQVLDRAIAPGYPSHNSKPRIFFLAVAGGLGLGLGLALLLDRLDRRVRYPEQATDELGLPIIGTVPGVKPRTEEFDVEEAAQVVEAFRTLRLNILHLMDPDGPMVFTITSPGAGDGKSLISSNLGMSFAESGRRTLIVDGDIRRGQLHSTFGVHQTPGLLDYLTGNASLEEVLQETDYERLTIVTCGGRRHRGPELLASQAMLQFLNAVRPLFDTIIVDSPPLGAGIDPFALGAATGTTVLVLRIGKSDRQMAQAKLAVLERYPVRILGAVLNDVKAEGAFRYYSYLYGYELDDGEQRAQLPSRVGEVVTPH
jgi:polysaccharide biosynthesis transport protein